MEAQQQHDLEFTPEHILAIFASINQKVLPDDLQIAAIYTDWTKNVFVMRLTSKEFDDIPEASTRRRSCISDWFQSL